MSSSGGHGEKHGEVQLQSNGAARFKGNVIMISGAILLAIFLYFVWGNHSAKEKVREAENIRRNQKVLDIETAQARDDNRCKYKRNVGPFEIPARGKMIYLCPGYELWVTGGKISVTNNETGSSYILDPMEPPKDVGYQPEGDYFLRPEPSGKRGAKVYY